MYMMFSTTLFPRTKCLLELYNIFTDNFITCSVAGVFMPRTQSTSFRLTGENVCLGIYGEGRNKMADNG